MKYLMVLHKGMPTLKIWKRFAGFEGFRMLLLLGCDPASYTRNTDNGRDLSVLIDHVIVISRTTWFPNTGYEGLRRCEFLKNSAWIRVYWDQTSTCEIRTRYFKVFFFNLNFPKSCVLCGISRCWKVPKRPRNSFVHVNDCSKSHALRICYFLK